MAIRYLSTTENLQKQPIIDPRDSPPNRSREGQLYYNTNSKGLQLYDGTSWSSVGSPGTVTSVGLSMPTAFSVANSPITGSGTFSVTGAGNSSQVVLGDGTLGPLPTGDVTGTGTTNYLSKFTGSSVIGDSLVFDNGTNVGIGTTIPTHQLSVAKDISVGSTGNDGLIQFKRGSNGGDIAKIGVTASTIYIREGQGSGGQLQTYEGTSALHWRYNAVGDTRVGINTNTTNLPAASLLVKGAGATSSTTALLVQNSSATNMLKVDDDGRTYFYDPLVAENLRISGSIIRGSRSSQTSYGGNKIDFSGNNLIYSARTKHQFQWNNNDRLVINQTGIGVMTTNPSQVLHVVGNARVTGAIYDSNNTPGTSGQVLSSTATGTDWVSLSEIQGVDGTGTANYVTKWSDSDTVTNSVIFDNGSNVGIGTTSPSAPLHINNAAPVIRLQDSSSGDNHYFTGNNGELRIQTTGYMTMRPGNSISTTFLANGNVGIGTTSPALQSGGTGLHINATTSSELKFTNSTTGTGAGDGTALVSNVNNFFINNREAGYMTLGTSNTERMRITSTGNVGIGTTSPGEKLHIASTTTPTLKIEDTTNNSTIEVAAGNFDSTIDTSGRLFINGSTTLAVSSSAVGVGVSSPTSAKLQVKGSGSTSSSTALLIQNSATTELFRVRDDGNVGIGTTSPGRTLDVAGRGRFIDSTSTVDILSSIYVPLLISNTGGYAHARINGFEVGGNTTATNEGYIKTADNSRKLLLDTNGWRFISTNTELMRLTSSGNVGIGTTSPAQKLHINGNFLLENNNEIRQKDSGGTQRTIIELDSSNDLNIGGSYSGALKFIGGGSYTEQMRIHDDGNVGIGTTSPNDKLDIVHTTSNLLGLNYGTNQLRFAVDNRSHIKWAGSSGTFYLSGRGNGLFIGSTSSDASARLHVKGSGTTSSTDALLIENSAGTDLFTVRDDGSVYALGSGAVATNTAFGKEAFKSNTTGSLNVAIGAEALELNTTGQQNTAVGFQAMENNLTGSDNTALGFKALENNTANENTAVGHESLQDNTTGTFNTAVGSKSLQNNTGSFNTAFGAYTLNTNTTGTNNVAVGINSLRLNTTGGSNTAVGREASYNNTTGASNTSIGYQASMDNTTGGSNTSIGYQASMNNATGSSNTAIGRDSLRNNTASNNTAVGYHSAKNNTSGVNLTALGVKALQANTTGNSNVAIGYFSLEKNTTGTDNVSVGTRSLVNNLTGSRNTAIGHDTLRNTTASDNTAVGYQSSYNNTTASYNISVGYRALYMNSTGTANVAVGKEALRGNTASYNTAIGYQASYTNTTGVDNIAVGKTALLFNQTGSLNLALGKDALRNNTASNNTALGHTALYSNTTGTENTAVGRRALVSNQTGSNNVAVGTEALENNTALGNTAVGSAAGKGISTGGSNVSMGWFAMANGDQGDYNVAIGRDALRFNEASSNIAIGFQALYDNTTGSGNIALGGLNNNTTGSRNVAIGGQGGNTTGSENISIGYAALTSNTASSYNIALGRESQKLSTAAQNISLGYRSMYSSTTGASNVAIGHQAMLDLTTGGANVAIGYQAAANATTPNNNVAIGRQAGFQGTVAASTVYVGGYAGYGVTGSNNVAVGLMSQFASNSGVYNTSLGNSALKNNTSSFNTAMGHLALQSNTTASNNTAVGYISAYSNTTGVGNSSFGSQSLMANQTGTRNNAFGVGALRTLNGGTGNACFGTETFRSTTTGSHNVGIGDYAGYYNITGSSNIALGYRSNFVNTTGNHNVAVGYQALYDNTASENTAIGHQALYDNTTATANTAVGKEAGLSVTTGGNNVFLGKSAGRGQTTGTLNVAIGPLSMYATGALGNSNIALGYYNQFSYTNASQNISIGIQAMQYNTTGSDNVVIGHAAAQGTSGVSAGSSNVVLGRFASTGGFNSSVVLGRNATATASNQFVVGSSSHNAGAVTTETITADKTWTVKINGVDYKIPIVAA